MVGQHRLAHWAGVCHQVANSTPARLLHARRKNGGVQSFIAHSRNRGATPKTGKLAAHWIIDPTSAAGLPVDIGCKYAQIIRHCQVSTEALMHPAKISAPDLFQHLRHVTKLFSIDAANIYRGWVVKTLI